MRVQKTIAIGSVLGLVLCMGEGAWAQEDVFNSSGEASASTDGSASADADSAESDDEAPKNKDAEADSGGGGGLKLERPLLLTRHTMELGGEITLSPQVGVLKGDVPDKSVGGGVLIFSPHLGYFVIDKLEIMFNFGLSVPFGDLNGWDDVDVNFALGARYFFDFNVVALYVGGLIGPSFEIPDATAAPVRKYFNINMMVGVLVALNRHIGIDLGMRMLIDVRMGDINDGDLRTRISFPMGYFGINGFFNIITGG